MNAGRDARRAPDGTAGATRLDAEDADAARRPRGCVAGWLECQTRSRWLAMASMERLVVTLFGSASVTS